MMSSSDPKELLPFPSFNELKKRYQTEFTASYKENIAASVKNSLRRLPRRLEGPFQPYNV